MVRDYVSYAVHEVLRDGGSIHVRAIRPDDKQRLVEHFEGLSRESVHFRFFGSKRKLTDEELTRFTEVDFRRNAALVATLEDAEGEHIIGVGRYMSTAEGRAEIAFVVSDRHQGRGIGTILLEHLAPIARQNGIDEFEADVLGENNRMLEVFRKSGFRVTRSLEAGVVHLRFPTEETPAVVEVSLDRDLEASAESLRHFLQPKSVAVCFGRGAPDPVGTGIVANLQRQPGVPVFVVHPARGEIEGMTARPTLEGIGQPVDLVIIAAAADEVLALVDDCSAAGARGVVLLGGPTTAATPERRRAAGELVTRVRRAGLRLIGPESLGIINNDPGARLLATPAVPPAPGRIGMLAQSGAFSLALLELAREQGVGLSSFVSVGDKADVSSNDLLAYWKDDAATAVIALYLESFGNPRRFARIAPMVARQKPIVAVKAGGVESELAGLAGTGQAWAREALAEALWQQSGVIRTRTIAELFGVLRVLNTQPVSAGSRLGVIGNAAGPVSLLVDACGGCGLEFSELSAQSQASLRQLVGGEIARSNPLDVSALPAAGYAEALAIVGADAGVDAVVVLHVPTPGLAPHEVAAAVARGAAAVPLEKPIAVVYVAATAVPPALHQGPRGQLPTFTFPEDAARALGAVASYSCWRRRPRGTAMSLDQTARETVRAVLKRALGKAGEPTRLEPRDVATLLRAAGIAHRESLAASGSGTSGSGTEGGARREGDELEAAVGLTNDALFGPLLSCRLRGGLLDVWPEAALRLTPLTDLDAVEMLDGLRASTLFAARGDVPAADRRGLEDILLRVSALVEIAPELRRLELDPIRLRPPSGGATVMAASIEV